MQHFREEGAGSGPKLATRILINQASSSVRATIVSVMIMVVMLIEQIVVIVRRHASFAGWYRIGSRSVAICRQGDAGAEACV